MIPRLLQLLVILNVDCVHMNINLNHYNKLDVCIFISLFYLHSINIDQPTRPIDPTVERLQLMNEENQRLKDELNDIHRRFETLDTRNYLYLFYSYH